MDWILVLSQNSYVELSLWWYLEMGLGKVIRFPCGPEGKTLKKKLMPLGGEKKEKAYTPRKGHMSTQWERDRPWPGTFVIPTLPATPILDFQLSDSEKINVCYWSYSVYSILFQQPKKTKTEVRNQLGEKLHGLRLLVWWGHIFFSVLLHNHICICKNHSPLLLESLDDENSFPTNLLENMLLLRKASLQRDDSLEKSLMLGKIEGRKRIGSQRMRWGWRESLMQWSWTWANSRRL